jgi:ketosteroid isomerase-like protein
MRIRLLLTLAGLAIGFALPISAQEQKTVDPKVRQEIEAVQVKYNEAVNKHDAAAIAALFTEDALQAWESSGGVDSNSGKKAIQRSYELGWEKTPFVGKVVQVYAIGNDIAAIEEWSAGDWKGYKVWVFFRDINSWKIRLQYGTLAPRVFTAEPAATPSPTASPSGQ